MNKAFVKKTYQRFKEITTIFEVCTAIVNDSIEPVTAQDGIQVMQIIEAIQAVPKRVIDL
jgi:hypothetical protein